MISDGGSLFAYQSPKQSTQSLPTTYDTLFGIYGCKGHACMHANKIQDAVLALNLFLTFLSVNFLASRASKMMIGQRGDDDDGAVQALSMPARAY